MQNNMLINDDVAAAALFVIGVVIFDNEFY